MDRPEQSDSDEQDIARLLRAAGPRQELPPQLQAQWEKTFRAELQPVLEGRNRRVHGVMLGLCASVLLVTAAWWFTLLEPVASHVSIEVRYVSGEHQMRDDVGSAHALQVDQQLRPGSSISTGANGFVTVNYNGYDLRLHHNTHIALAAERITVLAGQIYISDDQASSKAHELLIDTPHGTIRDIGTQFTVALLPHNTVTTVRRGAVQVNTGSTQLRVEAPPDSAIKVTLDENQTVQHTRVASTGTAWDWIYTGTPAYTLEGQSAYEFLQWSVSESGLHLQFADMEAEIYANNTLLHGNFGALNPEQAVTPVLATTDLQAQRKAGNTLLVSLQVRR